MTQRPIGPYPFDIEDLDEWVEVAPAAPQFHLRLAVHGLAESLLEALEDEYGWTAGEQVYPGTAAVLGWAALFTLEKAIELDKVLLAGAALEGGASWGDLAKLGHRSRQSLHRQLAASVDGWRDTTDDALSDEALALTRHVDSADLVKVLDRMQRRGASDPAQGG